MTPRKRVNHSPVSPDKITSVSILMPFTDALLQAVQGRRICKRSWNDEEHWIYFNFEGLLKIRKPDDSIHNLVVSKQDFDGDDWFTIEE